MKKALLVRVLSTFALIFIMVASISTDVTHSRQMGYVVNPADFVVSFYQVDFKFIKADGTSIDGANSSTAVVDVDVPRLMSITGIESGYINIFTKNGWVLQNMPIPREFTYKILSTAFRLRDPQAPPVIDKDVIGLDAYVLYSGVALLTNIRPSETELMRYGVGNIRFNAQGLGEYPQDQVTQIPDPPEIKDIPFKPGNSITESFIQPNHPTLETGVNECLPASVATGLKWFEYTYDLNLPDPNVPKSDDPGSLVAKLGNLMLTSSTLGTQIGYGVLGKLQYLVGNSLTNIEVNYQGSFAAGQDFRVPNINPVLTAYYQGDVDPIFIINKLRVVAAVEFGFHYYVGGGHSVEVVGAGQVFGVPWVMHQSDSVQGDNNVGNERVQFSYLVDDGSSPLALVNNVVPAYAQSVITQELSGNRYIKCKRTICFRSPQYYLLDARRIPPGLVTIGGYNFNNPTITRNFPAIRFALLGNAASYGTETPLQQLNREYVAAQLSMLASVGPVSPPPGSVLNSPLSCYNIQFPPVTLSNGYTLYTSSMLKNLFDQAYFAIQDDRQADMLIIARIFRMLNGDDPAGRCTR